MPIGVKLLDLRRDLRAETGQSLNVAQGVQSQSTQDIILDRQQRELWDAYDWPHLRFYKDVAVNAGQSLYSYPQEMPFDQINRIHWSDGTSAWKTLAYGIRASDLPLGTPQQGTPCRWGNKVTVTGGKTNPTAQIELYPVPQSSGWLRFDGQAPLNPLLEDNDTCIIDSKAIVLFAAAEILATQKVEAAALKLTKAQNYLRRILAQQGADKRANYNMGGNRRIDHLAARPYGAVEGIDYIR